ncbi:MAG: hypothetical protein TQ37_03585 [Candidatus Synechococcus spongiarum 15L]|uniref:Uncharacterized protein n=1 Tax=Candidatus Synechococcus spongiarum 15L TaxID=1608419 RepID=A0A0G8AWN5_9SYNE|nr:MAG: hypothetical protein TQ37_03585 [Candidatus Synechococcus spongiarum 15L]
MEIGKPSCAIFDARWLLPISCLESNQATTMRAGERSFVDVEWESKKRKTRKELFPDRMEVLIPWEKLL